MQTTAGNRSCIEAADRNDQTLEIAALRTESNLLKSELNVLKDLMLRQVGFLCYDYSIFTIFFSYSYQIFF